MRMRTRRDVSVRKPDVCAELAAFHQKLCLVRRGLLLREPTHHALLVFVDLSDGATPGRNKTDAQWQRRWPGVSSRPVRDDPQTSRNPSGKDFDDSHGRVLRLLVACHLLVLV